MSSLRVLNPERKVSRRGVKKTHSFKENQVLIGTEVSKKSQKRRRETRHVAIESPEFQLLVKLFVPASLLIKNNKVSISQLTAYLPQLVAEKYPRLNFELHIFISSLINAYVSSWYCEKLNTENTAFVLEVYETLCAFVKDISDRVSVIAEPERLLAFFNELADILNCHLRENYVEGGIPKYASLILERNACNVLRTSDLSDLRATYLAEKHVIFNEEWVKAVNIGDSGSKSSAQQIYLKILVKDILKTAFAEANTEVQGPRSSVIMTNFVTVLIADLVLVKLLDKLSDPDFLVSTVIGRTISKVLDETQSKQEPDMPRSVYSRLLTLQSGWEKLYGFIYSVSKLRNTDICTNEHAPTVMFSPVFSLLNAIFNISQRKPIVACVLSLARSAIFSFGKMGLAMEAVARRFFFSKFENSPVAEDAVLARSVEALRSSLFDRSNDARISEDKPKSVTQVRDEIYHEFFDSSKHKSIYFAPLSWISYKNESETEIKKSIEAFLRIFAPEVPKNASGDDRDKEINKLLAIKIVDCLVQNLYPEMTSGVCLILACRGTLTPSQYSKTLETLELNSESQS